MQQLRKFTTAKNKQEAFQNMKKGYNKAIAKIISYDQTNGFITYHITKLAKLHGEYKTRMSTTKCDAYATKTYSDKTNKESLLYIMKEYFGQKLIGKSILLDIEIKDNNFWVSGQLLQQNLSFYKQVNARNKRGINRYTSKNKDSMNLVSDQNKDSMNLVSGQYNDSINLVSGQYGLRMMSPKSIINQQVANPFEHQNIGTIEIQNIEHQKIEYQKETGAQHQPAQQVEQLDLSQKMNQAYNKYQQRLKEKEQKELEEKLARWA